MKRKIIKIHEKKCNGCGKCTNICAEAALEIVDGKAKLIKDFLCDGMGACLDVCPLDALEIVEIETEEYNPEKTYTHVKKVRGEEEAKKIHDYDKIKKHEEPAMQCGCPGSMMRDFKSDQRHDNHNQPQTTSALEQWPVQLHLLMPDAPYFENANLLIAADCAPFAYGSFHNDFLKNKKLSILCPKLDQNQESYIEKLSLIFRTQNIQSITIVRMEVPCCGGIEHIINEAKKRAEIEIETEVKIISIQGNIKE